MKRKEITHNEWKRLHVVTTMQNYRIEQLHAEMLKLTPFGNVQARNEEYLFIIARNGHITFRDRRV